MAIEVELVIENSVQKVYAAPFEFSQGKGYHYSAFLSYPDSRATRMTIYETTNSWVGWNKMVSVPLKSHSFLNLSYYINDGFNPIANNPSPPLVTDLPTLLFNVERISVCEPNKIKVSGLNNPMSFFNENTYQIGNGKILALSTNAIRISEGQFGQYPLYIFTTKGIYSLNVGSGETVYSAQSAPTSYETPINTAVCSTPFGVVFATQRGLCIIRGQEVELISSKIEQPQAALNLQYNEKLEDILLDFPQRSFPDYLKEARTITYNPHENEIIVVDSQSAFNYVVNLDNGSFYQSTERVDGV